jgi:hypothetical protein
VRARPDRRRRLGRLARVLTALALLGVIACPLAAAADVWSNVAPASEVPGGSLQERYPLGNYWLDAQFEAVDASLTGGVDVSGVPPMLAHVLATVLWEATRWLANLLITLFSFAFSLDLLSGSKETGGAGALAPVATAIHSIYANVFGAPWLVLAVTVVGLWALWKTLLQRRYSETVGALGLSLVYLVIALAFVTQPAKTIGQASHWTNQMSEAFLTISHRGTVTGTGEAKRTAADQLFRLLVYEPWMVLQFGGTEHCVRAGTGSEDEDPVSVPVRPLPQSAARRLAGGAEVGAEGKTCIHHSKYAPHFLAFSPGSDERDDEYEALNDGDASKLPEADPSARSGDYHLGPADKPATDAMEEGGQFQRLAVALLIFAGELGAFVLLGALSVGVILAQVLLLLMLAFAPVTLVFAVIPGRGHNFFVGWLTRLAGLLLRKAAYSLTLALLLAVAGALAVATIQLGWLLSFGLQSLFFWAVFIQRRQLTDRLIGAVAGTEAARQDGALRLLAVYGGLRAMNRPLRSGRRSAGRALRRMRSSLPGGRGGSGIGPALGQTSDRASEGSSSRPESGSRPAGEKPAAASSYPLPPGSEDWVPPITAADVKEAHEPVERYERGKASRGPQREDGDARPAPPRRSKAGRKGGPRSARASQEAQPTITSHPAGRKPPTAGSPQTSPPSSAAPRPSLADELKAERERVERSAKGKGTPPKDGDVDERPAPPRRRKKSRGGNR